MLLLLSFALVAGAWAQGRRGGGAGGGAGGGEFAGLGKQIDAAQNAGDLVLAEELARRRVALAANAGARLQGVAYRNLGTILRKRGKFADAEAMLRTALPLLERSVGRNAYQTVRALLNIAELQTSQSRYADAGATYRDALARQLASGPDTQDVIKIYFHLADLERRLQHYAEAEDLLLKADAVPGKVGQGNDSEQSLARLRAITVRAHAEALMGLGRIPEAQARAREALAAIERVAPRDHPDVADACTVLGAALLRGGRAAEAEQVYRRALAISERAHGPNHPRTARSGQGLAQALLGLGRPGEAEPLLKRALGASSQSGGSEQQARLERAYGLVLARANQLAEALGHYRTALDLVDRIFAQTQGLDEATRENFVGRYASYYVESLRLLLRLNAAQPGRGYDREALALVSRTQSRLFTELLRKADVNKLAGDAAFVDLRRRQGVLKATLAELRRARTLANDTASDDGDDDAEEEGSASRSKAPARAHADPLIEARQAESRARIAQAQAAGERDLAAVEDALWKRYPRYMELTQPRPVTVEALQRDLLRPEEALLSYYLLPDRVLIFLIGRSEFRMTEVRRPRDEVVALVAAARRPEESADIAQLARLDPAVLNALYEILVKPVESGLRNGQKLLVVGDGPLHTLPLEMLVTQWGDAERSRFEAARAQQGQSLGEYATLPYLAQRYRFAYLPSLSALASARLYRKAAVSYDRELVSFADPVFEKGAAGSIARGVLDSVSRSARPSAAPGPVSIARLPETADEARDIAATLGGRSSVYLREQAQEHTAKTLDLKTTRYLHFATHGLLGGEFTLVSESLAAAEKQIAAAGAQRNLAVAAAPGKQASAAQPAADAGGEAGLDLEDAPPDAGGERGQPALVLSLSGELQGEDGLLTMSEVIEAMDINSRLVVLSACNTAGENAKASTGEGFAGLTRAFMYAGAQGLVVSHWSVESRSTQELMSDLFRALRGGAESLAALEGARERMRGSRGAQNVSRAHPYFWAPFVYVGD